MATDAVAGVVWEYTICYIFMIRHRMAENNQNHLPYGFKNILFLGYLPFRPYHLPPGVLSLRKDEPLPELEDNGME